MDFSTYYKSLKRKEKQNLAEKLGTSIPHLWQLSIGHRKAGAKFLKLIPQVTNGLVTAEMLRPDLQTTE